MDRKINRIKTALVDKGKTNKWLAEQAQRNPQGNGNWGDNNSGNSMRLNQEEGN